MTTHAPLHIVFTGGGTGGHLFPGIAVAQQLRRDLPDARITFAGSGREFEQYHVQQAGYEYLAMRCRPLPRRPWRIGSFLVENFRGYRAARRFLDRHEVAAVVGLGGYASAVMARAAIRRGVPLVLLEQNLFPGRTTRWLAKSATFVCASMDETIAHLDPHCPVLVTGNPLRAPFLPSSRNSPRPLAGEGPGVRAAGNKAAAKHAVLHSAHDKHSPHLFHSTTATRQQPLRQLLVLGGSSGARTLNEHVPRALATLGWALRGWRIVHQAGQGHVEATRRLYRNLQLDATVVPFIPDTAQALSETDLAVCRAGGTTLAELAALSVPAVLLPYPYAADDHQLKNAQWFAASEGCIVVDERRHPTDLPDRLADTLGPLLSQDGACEAMSRAIHTLARPDATRDVATLIEQLVAHR